MLDSYLKKRPRSNYWQLRVPVPKDVWTAFGRREFTQSMREHDRAKAEEAAIAIIVKLKAEWNALRSTAQINAAPNDEELGPPTDTEMAAIASDIYRKSVAIARDTRGKVYARNEEGYLDYLAKQERLQTSYVREIDSENFGRWEDTAERFLRERGRPADRETDWFRKFAAMVAEVTVAAVDVTNRRERGDLGAKPSSEVLERALQVADEQSVSAVDLAFSKLVDAFMRQWKAGANARKVTNTEQQKRATFKLFGGFWADGHIRGVRSEDAAAFRDKLKLLDPNWSRAPSARRLDWEALLAAYGNQPVGLADATMNRHMTTLQNLWDWARKRGHCQGENPFEGFHKKLRAGVNVRPYLPWEQHELRELFTPVPRRIDMLEVMIVAMFTGMRLDEIASLTWGKVRVGEHQVTYFQVDDPKTPAGIRQVPVHPKLNWLKSRKRGTDGQRLWPNFNEEGVGKKAGADASREFSSFKAARGFNDRQKTFHSFRKNVTKIMERAGVPENEWAQVFGHERGFTYSVYNPDGITLARKAEIIRLIEYQGVSIPHPTS